MRIAVASDDGVNVALHTGRCAGFVIFEIKDNEVCEVEYRKNGFTAHALGQCTGEHSHDTGQHHSHAPLVDALADCSVLVTRGLGPRLVIDLATGGIEAFICVVEKAQDAAGQYAKGALLRAEAGGGCCCHG